MKDTDFINQFQNCIEALYLGLKPYQVPVK